jgi:hypothetical protein
LSSLLSSKDRFESIEVLAGSRYPVKAFLRHTEGDDDIDAIAIALVGRVFQGVGDFIPFRGIVVYEIGNFEDGAVGCFDELKPGLRIGALPFAPCFDDVLDLPDFVLGDLYINKIPAI